MKGLTHFVSGVALGSFFAPAVKMAASTRLAGVEDAASSMILVLGGVYGILPDTLDFKLGQFLSRAEVQVDCDPVKPDAQKMAEQLGQAMEEAFASGRRVRAQLQPMRLGADMWRQYVIRFDGQVNEVTVVLNEAVTTSQVAFPGSAPPEDRRVGRYRLRQGKILETHGKPSVVDIMSGPQYGFRRHGEHVLVEFLPWHRTWSHSYTLGALLALLPLAAALALGLPHAWLYWMVAFLGFAIHITEDLTGHMGGALLWPFQKNRTGGLRLFTASHVGANFLTIYGASVITLYNLDRFTTHAIHMGALQYFLLFLALPAFLFQATQWLFARPDAKGKRGIQSAEAALARLERLKAEEIAFEDDQVPAG